MRFEKNLEILKFLKSGVSLTDYSGFGGLHKSMSNQQRQQLKDLLGNDLYNEIMDSCKTAYYTPVEIINAIYKGLTKLGFTGGKILEPACGHGAFIFNCPSELKNNSSFYAVELERVSAKLTRIICPYASVVRAGFENVNFKDNSFDVAIGNPPYSNQVIYSEDKELNDLVVHHYFMARSIRLLKENGILAFVVPTYVLDNTKSHARHVMHKYGSILAAFRLPENMFDSAKVTVDIVFFIKNKEHYTNYLNTVDTFVKGYSFPVNQYFIDNPSHVIGNFDTCNMYKRKGLTVKNFNPKEIIFANLNALIDKLPKLATYKNVDTNSNIFSKMDSSIQKLSKSSSNLLQKRLNDLEIQKIEILRQELLDIEKKRLAILSALDNC